ncbi:hypothetical protein VMT65_15690 [Nocardia sp. CDC153]|uniref:hypothetical protein n=1 Tax=Nocardia sp. CDC153 TaxID=3112167 RepID=UPI002DBCA50C|nr:hypothetical protein [Nocardia sp. CDC153]MEC3954484.1 hypothetical protein [Nocardia sp. CDC153]
MAVTELSDDAMGDSLKPGTGIGTREDAQRVLGDDQPPAPAATSCRTLAATNPSGASFCEVPLTNDMLKTIADLPGSIGYSEYSYAAGNSGVKTVTID